MKKLRLYATATFGVESVVAREIKHLGYEDTFTDNGKIFLTVILKRFAVQICGFARQGVFMF